MTRYNESARALAGSKAAKAPAILSATLGPLMAAVLLAAMALGLSGCGNDPVTRGVSGGLIGAGAGAGIAAVTGGRPATGALIGGGVGAAGGVLTSP
jgi:osmotically inducible lipoprotein OsmB